MDRDIVVAVGEDSLNQSEEPFVLRFIKWFVGAGVLLLFWDHLLSSIFSKIIGYIWFILFFIKTLIVGSIFLLILIIIILVISGTSGGIIPIVNSVLSILKGLIVMSLNLISWVFYLITLGVESGILQIFILLFLAEFLLISYSFLFLWNLIPATFIAVASTQGWTINNWIWQVLTIGIREAYYLAINYPMRYIIFLILTIIIESNTHLKN